MKSPPLAMNKCLLLQNTLVGKLIIGLILKKNIYIMHFDLHISNLHNSRFQDAQRNIITASYVVLVSVLFFLRNCPCLVTFAFIQCHPIPKCQK